MNKSLATWINARQQNGQYSFTRAAALSALQCSSQTLSVGINRLVRKNRLMNIRAGFYVVVPTEYSYRGVLPPTWFIDHLMRHISDDYYIGLLSAASFYGATHQAPQIFQVVTRKSLRKIETKGLSIHFYRSNLLDKVPIQHKRTPTGDIKVASATVTAFDIIKYMSASGGLYNAATVLSELLENIRISELTDIINRALYDRTVVQRLGFLLEQKEVGGSKYANEIYKIFEKNYTFRNTLLNPYSSQKTGALDQKWHIIVNDIIEVDI